MKRMLPKDLIEDVDWLLSNGVHPAMVVDQIGKSAEAIEIAARRTDRPDISAQFSQLRRGLA